MRLVALLCFVCLWALLSAEAAQVAGARRQRLRAGKASGMERATMKSIATDMAGLNTCAIWRPQGTLNIKAGGALADCSHASPKNYGKCGFVAGDDVRSIPRTIYTQLAGLDPFLYENADGGAVKTQYLADQEILFKAGMKLKAGKLGRRILSAGTAVKYPISPSDLAEACFPKFVRVDGTLEPDVVAANLPDENLPAGSVALPKVPGYASSGNSRGEPVKNNLVIGVLRVKCTAMAASRTVGVIVSSTQDLRDPAFMDFTGIHSGAIADGTFFDATCPQVVLDAHARSKCYYYPKASSGGYSVGNPLRINENTPCNGVGEADSDIAVLRSLIRLRGKIAAAKDHAKQINVDRKRGFAGTILQDICADPVIDTHTPGADLAERRQNYDTAVDAIRVAAIYFDERSICNCCEWEMKNANVGNVLDGLGMTSADMFEGGYTVRFGAQNWLKIVMGPSAARRRVPVPRNPADGAYLNDQVEVGGVRDADDVIVGAVVAQHRTGVIGCRVQYPNAGNDEGWPPTIDGWRMTVDGTAFAVNNPPCH